MSRSKSPERLLAPLEIFGIRPGLDATRSVLGRIGEPQRGFASVLVAGTNGKGSTACMLAAIAAAAGYRVGLYTSPHLERVTERVRIGGEAIPSNELAREIERVLAAAERMTYFEALTAAALAYFAARRVELAILEVGLGGRLDATNVVDPVLSLICEISLDHQKHLGSSLGAIAAEKAGVFRSGRTALCWDPCPEVLAVLETRARETGADLRIAAREMEIAPPAEASNTERGLRLSTPAGRYRLRSPLAGVHQVANLGLAVRAAELLAAAGWSGLASRESVAAVERCRWPGRLERVPIGDGREVLLDAAHNASGAHVLAQFLRRRGEPYRLLFGARRDKEADRMLAYLTPAATEVYLTAPPGGRAWPPERLIQWSRGPVRRVESEVEPALDAALAGGDGVLVVCGSIYLLGAVRSLLRRRFGVPPPATEPLWPGKPEARKPAPGERAQPTDAGESSA